MLFPEKLKMQAGIAKCEGLRYETTKLLLLSLFFYLYTKNRLTLCGAAFAKAEPNAVTRPVISFFLDEALQSTNNSTKVSKDSL